MTVTLDDSGPNGNDGLGAGSDYTEEAVAAIDHAELASIRAKLVAADVLPSASRAVAM